MTTPFHPPLPDELAQVSEQWWATYCEAAAAASVRPPQDSAFIMAIKRVWALSDFVGRVCQRDPRVLPDFISSGAFASSYPSGRLSEKLRAALQPVADGLASRVTGASTDSELDPLKTLQQSLRCFRNQEMVRIAYRDILGLADLRETMRDLSALADACIDQTLKLLYAWQCRVDGTPCSRDGIPQHLVVIGLGKLGGRELNVSSDVDLILAYPQAGQTDRASGAVGNDVFFTHLGRRLIQALGAVTADGCVFRVDLRLRPDGDNGPLVMSFDNMEQNLSLLHN